MHKGVSGVGGILKGMNDWLIKSPRGWVEPGPPECDCGGTRYLIGWVACPCQGGPYTGGHRTWECTRCGRQVEVGCLRSADG